MAFFSVMLLIPEHTVCCLLILTSSERLVKSLSTRPHCAILLSLRLQEMMSSAPPSLKMRRKKLRRVMLRLPRVLWTQSPPPRARTMMTAPTTSTSRGPIEQVTQPSSAAPEEAPVLVEEEATSTREAPRHIQRRHPPQQMLG